ncbi:MAG: RNA polymerase sigma factor FliA [Pseudomonadales bacterium]|nr:RNA polymerase sigma factor FliA [Pseudomonadales bacterium]
MYQETQTVDMNGLVEQHAVLVKRIAHHLLSRLPASVQLDDLIQSGMIGLFEAAGRFDASRGARFETYAGIRIRGAMLDEVRRGDWTPRSVHRQSRAISDAIKNIEQQHGIDARDQDIADAMEISMDEYHRLLADISGSKLFSLEELKMMTEGSELPDSDESRSADENPFDIVQKQDFERYLAEVIKGLADRDKTVLSLYYDQEMNLKEIGEILEVSESRVSQIHSQAVLKVRARISRWKNNQ